MDFRATALLLIISLVAGFSAWACRAKRSAPAEGDPADRVEVARARAGAVIRERCAAAGLRYPPQKLFLRAFKAEAELEMWAGADDGPLRLLATYPFTANSGGPGPKRQEGDRQIPEGCYRITVFNPRSQYHLSLGLDYPNASDRVRSDRNRPGDEIYIHGGAKTIGCIPLGDAPIEELFLIALDIHGGGEREIPVHIFPARMHGQRWETLRSQHPEHEPFWAELEKIHGAFEKTKEVPRIEINADGAYLVAGAL